MTAKTPTAMAREQPFGGPDRDRVKLNELSMDNLLKERAVVYRQLRGLLGDMQSSVGRDTQDVAELREVAIVNLEQRLDRIEGMLSKFTPKGSSPFISTNTALSKLSADERQQLGRTESIYDRYQAELNLLRNGVAYIKGTPEYLLSSTQKELAARRQAQLNERELHWRHQQEKALAAQLRELSDARRHDKRWHDRHAQLNKRLAAIRLKIGALEKDYEDLRPARDLDRAAKTIQAREKSLAAIDKRIANFQKEHAGNPSGYKGVDKARYARLQQDREWATNRLQHSKGLYATALTPTLKISDAIVKPGLIKLLNERIEGVSKLAENAQRQLVWLKSLGESRGLTERLQSSDGGSVPFSPEFIADFTPGRYDQIVKNPTVVRGGRFGADRDYGGHSGIDLAVPVNTPVHAAGSGVVFFAGNQSGYGYTIKILHNTPQGPRLSVYAHCNKLLKRAGDPVNAGELIALSGNTGSKSEGAHVHFEIRKPRGNGQTIPSSHRNNYWAALNPALNDFWNPTSHAHDNQSLIASGKIPEKGLAQGGTKKKGAHA